MANNEVTEEDCANRFVVSARELLDAMAGRIDIQRRTLDVFNVPLPDGRGFYPDFVVGIHGRKTEDGALLADPKWGYDRTEEAPKAGAMHPAFGSVLVLFRDQDARWLTVRYDAEKDRAYTGPEFLLSDAAGFGLPSQPSTTSSSRRMENSAPPMTLSEAP